MCIRIYIFNFKKQTSKQKKTIKAKKAKRNKWIKENISGKSIRINKFAADRVKIFFNTRISRNKSIFLPNILIAITKVENTSQPEGRNKKYAEGGWWTLSESYDKQMISLWILISNLKFFSYVLQNPHLQCKQISLRFHSNLDIHYKKNKTF